MTGSDFPCSDLLFRRAWLPRGDYRLQCHLHGLNLPPGEYRLRLILFADVARERTVQADQSIPLRLSHPLDAGGLRKPAWSLESLPGTPPVEDLAWSRGHADWFFRHFDHAALVVTDYLLKRSPLLKGRILDVGCGDGIIDLGATPVEYWQWFTELNPIRVADFERELRGLGFEPWRVALRSSDLVEYTPELQRYPMQDLTTAELYLSAWNRKGL